jgi:hypothetical protein
MEGALIVSRRFVWEYGFNWVWDWVWGCGRGIHFKLVLLSAYVEQETDSKCKHCGGNPEVDISKNRNNRWLHEYACGGFYD